MSIKLSIITINKNNAAGLEKTLRSVIGQKFTNYEYIIIDGASTDNSVEIIKKYSEHIHYWVSEPDSGIFNAMNKGIGKAKGEYVIFMNSGDWFVNENTLMNVFSKEHTADLIVGNVILDFHKYYKERLSPPADITFHLFFSGGTLHHQATFTKAILFDEIGLYDERYLIASDWKFALLAVAKYNKSVETINEDIALRDVTGISLSKESASIIKKEHYEILQEYFPRFYNDYRILHRKTRYTFKRLRKHIKWRFRAVFANKKIIL